VKHMDKMLITKEVMAPILPSKLATVDKCKDDLRRSLLRVISQCPLSAVGSMVGWFFLARQEV
jgi:hypothetical protein